MEYELFLDDIRNPEDAYKLTSQPVYDLLDWVIIRNYDEFVKCVEERGIPWTISFDHDLGFDEFLENDYEGYDPDNEKNGLHCAKWLINYCLDNEVKPPQVVLIHSQNGQGSLDIKSVFETYNKVHGNTADNRKIVNYK